MLVVGEHHDRLRPRRREMQTETFQKAMHQRNAIEGTISEFSRNGGRRTRYRGHAKTSLHGYLHGAAINAKRWLRLLQRDLLEANEYHFGDFHGNALEMLRRGYDVHLHFANFGIRKLMFRLPAGLPWNKGTFDAYALDDGIAWKADKKGGGGILEIDPAADAGTYEEGFFEIDGLVSAMGRIREMLIEGDLRPLYLAWLACCEDPDANEPPVPAGLAELPAELAELTQFYELNKDLIRAAGAPAVDV